MQIKSELEKVKARLTAGWCQGSWALNANGMAVESTSPTACKWCLMGAIYSLGLPYMGRAIITKRLEDLLPEELLLTEFNDYQTSRDPILALIDKAIAAC